MNPIESLNSHVELDEHGAVIYRKVYHLPKVGRLAVREQPEVKELPGAEGLRAFYEASRQHNMNMRNPWAPTQPMMDN